MSYMESNDEMPYDAGSILNSGSSVPVDSYSPGIDFSGWGTTLQGIATIGANAYTQNMMMQTNQNGQRYLEGLRLSALQNTLSFNPSTIMLLGGAALLFVLLKN